MKRLFLLLLSIFLLFTISPLCSFASSESATAKLQEMYAQGELLMAQGDYASAAAQFETLAAYSDATQMAMYCKGLMAAENLGMYDVAISAFQELGDFKDSKQLVTYYQGRSYQAAADAWIESEARFDLVNARDSYDEAAKVYSGLALFKDCLTRLSACQSGSDKAKEKILAYDYAAADKLEQDGKFDEALKTFQALGSYKDCVERTKAVQEKIYARDYAAADQLEQKGKFEDALKAFQALGSYSDSTERVKSVQEKIYARDYAAADQLEQEGKFEDALKAFQALGSYSDSTERIKHVQNKIFHRDCQIIGNYVTFGTYPQTKSGKDSTPIEWLVLDVKDNKAFLISHYGLDTQPYNTKWVNITWAKCTIRSWLNTVFFDKAFSLMEKKALLSTNVDNSNSQGYREWNTDGGENTQDKVFLLSYAEACRYFKDDSARICGLTDFAIKQGGWTLSTLVDGREKGQWWLRSPGSQQNGAAFYNAGGYLSPSGSDVNCGLISIRPALWIDLESDIY